MEPTEITEKTALDSLAALVAQSEKLMLRLPQDDPHRTQFAGFLDAAKRQFARHISTVCKKNDESSEMDRLVSKAEVSSRLASDMEQFHYRPIGVLESVFTELNGCPRQGSLAPHSRGKIKIRKDLDPKNALRGLKDYSHVWLLFVFHRNTNTKYHPVVAPPKLGGAKLGVFATRSPHRPSNIGLTVAVVDSVDGDTVSLTGVDLVDGTPILDIKPYVPADVILDCKVPEWVAGGGKPAIEQISRVSFTEEAREQLRRSLPRLKFYSTEEEAIAVIEEVLVLDIRTTHMRDKHTRKVYGVCVDTVNVVFEIVEETAAEGAADTATTQAISVIKIEEIPPQKRRKTAGDYVEPPAVSSSTDDA